MATPETSAAVEPNPGPNGPPARPQKSVTRVVSSKIFQGSIAFLAFLAIFAFFGIWLGGEFFSAQARVLDIHQNAAVLLLGLAVLMGLIAGQFDLSVASMATLTTFLTVGLAVKQHWPFALVVLACLAVGLGGGLLNGLLVVRVRVNAFIATLGTGGIFLGLSAVYSKGAQITPGVGTNSALPSWFTGSSSFGAATDTVPAAAMWIVFVGVLVGIFFSLRRTRIGSGSPRRRDIALAGSVVILGAILVAVGIGDWLERVSWTVALLIAVALALWTMLSFTMFGRHLRATGSNPVAARLSGVDPDRETIKAFIIGGMLAALAGIVLAANQGSASPNIAGPYLLPAFAAAFLSTVILSNGQFQVWGTLIGGMFLVWVNQGLILGGLPFTWTEIVSGLVLVSAVSLSTVFRRTR